MRKHVLFLLVLVNLSWGINLFFWFNNVDLSYMKTYFDLVSPLDNLSILSLIRGHVLINFLTYLLFGIRPWGFYLVANLLHSLATVLLFVLCNKLFKDTKISFLLSLAFGISAVYSDVLFEGSFNQYYSFILILLLLNVFVLFTKRHFLIPSLLLIAGLMLRETALLLPVLTALILYIYRRKALLKTLVPLVAVAFLYLIFRDNLLGELKSDLTDDAVQARMAFMASGQYLKWFAFSIINFLRIISEQIIPHPVLYFLRDKLLALGQGNSVAIEKMSVMYVVAVGGSLFILISRFIYKLIKDPHTSKEIKKISLLGFGWLVAVNFFIALVLPFPSHVLAQKYSFESPLSRYNYYGFIGLVILLGVVVLKKPKVQKLVVFYILSQLILIWYGGVSLYSNKHAKANNFYSYVLTKYTAFPDETFIYYNFFQVNNLRDYVGDLKNIYGPKFYPNSKFILETGLSHLQEEFINKNTPLENIFAFDLDNKGYLVDKTDKLRMFLENSDSVIETSLTKDTKDYTIKVTGQSALANASYQLNFEARSISGLATNNCNNNLALYSQEKLRFIKETAIESSTNYGDYPRFFFIHPDNLLDNQLGSDSYWQANIGDTEQSVTLDLGSLKKVNGLAWFSGNKYAMPYDYSILSSRDKSNWQEVNKVTGNTSEGKIEKFAPQETRYIKFIVQNTSLGQPVYLREIEALNYPDEILKKYDKLDNLMKEAFINACITTSNRWVNFIINTDQASIKEILYVLGKGAGWEKYSINLVNLEPFSNSKQILDENLVSIIIKDVPDLEVRNVELRLNK